MIDPGVRVGLGGCRSDNVNPTGLRTFDWFRDGPGARTTSPDEARLVPPDGPGRGPCCVEEIGKGFRGTGDSGRLTKVYGGVDRSVGGLQDFRRNGR